MVYRHPKIDLAKYIPVGVSLSSCISTAKEYNNYFYFSAPETESYFNIDVADMGWLIAKSTCEPVTDPKLLQLLNF